MVSWDPAHVAPRIIMRVYVKYRSLGPNVCPHYHFVCMLISYAKGDQKNSLANHYSQLRCVYSEEKTPFGRVVWQGCR